MAVINYAVIGYITIMSLCGFLLMGSDKRRAIRKEWRIPEGTLLFMAFLGGGIGSFLGMRIFHHKTKHKKFVILLPLAAMLYLLVLFKISQLI